MVQFGRPRPLAARLPGKHAALLILAALVALAGCGNDNGGTNADTGVIPAPDTGADATGDAADAADAPPTADAGSTPVPVSQCDPLVEQQCAMPWPSNLYLAHDDTRATGYTLTFGDTSLPANISGKHVDAAPFKRLDGYGLGVPIMAIFPNVDTSQMAGRYSVDKSVADDAPIVLLEVSDDGSTTRVPYWAELDVTADAPDDQTLFVRPAVILKENTRYVVAFRNLKTTDGKDVPRSAAFQKLLDGQTDDDPALAARQARFDEVFGILADAGVSRDSLTLAWDFQTASDDGLHHRMLHMRDDALQVTGPQGPELTVTKVQEFAPSDDGSGLPVDPNIYLEIAGTMKVPEYMKQDGPGFVFNLDEDGNVVQNGTRQVKFLARIPYAAKDTPARLITFGHGLMGDREDIREDFLGRVANQYDYILVATDLVGMAPEDEAAALSALVDVSKFTRVADRLHQGILNFILLTRAAKERLPQLDAVTSRGIQVDTSEQYYFGASQGGIFGQTFMALSPDVHRGFLGVPGNDYSTLLYRSSGFAQVIPQIKTRYRSAADVAVDFALMQLLWDGTEPVSYVRHIHDDPFGGDPREVLMDISKGDHQVAVVTNENVARSHIGIPILEHYDDERTPWNVEQVSYPHTGSGIVLFDFGNPWPDNGNGPATDGMSDPHGALANVPQVGGQVDHFLRTGEIIDICHGVPCRPPL